MSDVTEQIAMGERRIAVSYETDQTDFAARVADILRPGVGSVVLLEPYAETDEEIYTDFDDLLNRGPRLDHQYGELHRADPDTLLVIGRYERGIGSTIGRQGFVDMVLAAAAGNWGPARAHRAGERACSSIVTLGEPEQIIGLPPAEIVGDVHGRIQSANDHFGSPIIDRIAALSRQKAQLMTNDNHTKLSLRME